MIVLLTRIEQIPVGNVKKRSSLCAFGSGLQCTGSKRHLKLLSLRILGSSDSDRKTEQDHSTDW